MIDGERNLTLSNIEGLTRGLKLREEEAAFFKNLVLYNQARTADEKSIYIKKILQSKDHQKLFPLGQAQYEFFARWFSVPIREMVALPGFIEDPEWIAQQFNFPIRSQDVKTAIQEMLQLGLLKRDESGRLLQAEAHVTTQDSIVSAALAKSHQEIIKRGAESIDRVPREQRDILGVTFAVSSENLSKIKEKIFTFRKEMVELLSAEQNPDTIYQFHLLLFPMVHVSQNERGS